MIGGYVRTRPGVWANAEAIWWPGRDGAAKR
jgi:hypothetical protein